MTIIADQANTADATPKLRKHRRRQQILDQARNHPDPVVRRNVALRRGRVSVNYLDNTQELTVDGDQAAPIADDADPNYRTPTTDAELARSVDAQLIAASGTGAARIEAAGRFSYRTRPQGAPAIGLDQVLELAPHRAYKALAALLDEQDIHSPYLQLADRVLDEHERTDRAAAALTAADRDFPAEQMSTTYLSPAQKIMQNLDSNHDDDHDDDHDSDVDQDSDSARAGAHSPHPDTSPELAYTPAPQDYDERGQLTLNALEASDIDSWWQAHLQGRTHAYVALADELVDMWAAEPWVEADLTLEQADRLPHPHTLN